MRKQQKKRVCVAQLGAAHGLKGEMWLRSFTEEPGAVAGYGALETEDGARSFEIVNLRAAKDRFVVKLSGIDNRDAAETLRNVKLYVPRDRLPAIGDESFYHADLIGLAAVTTRGEALGELIAIQNYGAGDILEIRLRDGTTVMLPFTDTTAPNVDIDAGKIVVDPPEGALTDASNHSPPPLRGRSAPTAPRGG
ncbi:MAG: ribosome maturation factor RimM [Rhizobiales bacterium]|nr:ribosome maturation factor RimM [Hyphomicrobiales bacterium]